MLGGLLLIATPSFAQRGYDIRTAPPARQHETRTARTSQTAVWQGGYHAYDADKKQYNWVRGHMGRATSCSREVGAATVQATWQQLWLRRGTLEIEREIQPLQERAML